MENIDIEWIRRTYPKFVSKDQVYRICHVSKATALFLLQSGLIPCTDSGKKTRRYKVKLDDVIEYLLTQIRPSVIWRSIILDGLLTSITRKIRGMPISGQRKAYREYTQYGPVKSVAIRSLLMISISLLKNCIFSTHISEGGLFYEPM